MYLCVQSCIISLLWLTHLSLFYFIIVLATATAKAAGTAPTAQAESAKSTDDVPQSVVFVYFQIMCLSFNLNVTLTWQHMTDSFLFMIIIS